MTDPWIVTAATVKRCVLWEASYAVDGADRAAAGRPAPGQVTDHGAPSAVISYLQAIVIGLLQGATELFPVSSLGHSVLVPAWLGWHGVVGQQSAQESPYLAFLVALHVATALAL